MHFQKYITFKTEPGRNTKSNRPVTSNEIEVVLKKLWTHKIQGPDGFTSDFYQIFK